MIAWSVRRDDELLASGAFSTQLLCDGGAHEDEPIAPRSRVQLVSLVRDQALLLLQTARQHALGSADAGKDNDDAAARSIEFPIRHDVLTLVHLSSRSSPSFVRGRGRQATAAEVSAEPLLTCRLDVLELPLSSSPSRDAHHDATWLDVKIRRASECRERGNVAFKREKLKRAVRAYKQALQWLACPIDCVYDTTEAARIDPLALACYTNLATTNWKLGDYDACIQYATHALQRDPQSVKALYRRSQALGATKAFDDAVRDLERAHQLEPDNTLVRSALERARTAQMQFTAKQQQAFKQLFWRDW